MRSGILTTKAHGQLDRALGVMLTAYGSGQVSASDVINNTMHMIAAVDCGNITEVMSFIDNPLPSKEG